jgi:hypothetical protein
VNSCGPVPAARRGRTHGAVTMPRAANGCGATRSAPRESASCGAVAGQREKAADHTKEPVGGEAVESGTTTTFRYGGGTSGGHR